VSAEVKAKKKIMLGEHRHSVFMESSSQVQAPSLPPQAWEPNICHLSTQKTGRKAQLCAVCWKWHLFMACLSMCHIIRKREAPRLLNL